MSVPASVPRFRWRAAADLHQPGGLVGGSSSAPADASGGRWGLPPALPARQPSSLTRHQSGQAGLAGRAESTLAALASDASQRTGPRSPAYNPACRQARAGPQCAPRCDNGTVQAALASPASSGRSYARGTISNPRARPRAATNHRSPSATCRERRRSTPRAAASTPRHQPVRRVRSAISSRRAFLASSPRMEPASCLSSPRCAASSRRAPRISCSGSATGLRRPRAIPSGSAAPGSEVGSRGVPERESNPYPLQKWF